MIEAQSITKRYGAFLAINHLSFQIKKGEVVGLLGPNGAGKTTTMRIITGFMPPSEGRVLVNGLDLLEHPKEAKRQIGYLPETPPLYPELTVQESLRFVAGLQGLNSQSKEKIELSLEKTGLADVQKRIVGNLSKGYRQRLGLAQAILHQPDFLILDEPTIGLDPKQILEIRELIQSFKGERAILLSSHILQEVTAVCDRVIIIHKGQIVANGPIGELTQSLSKKRFIVTVGRGKELRQDLEKLPGVESVADYSSDLEEIFLNLTKEQ